MGIAPRFRYLLLTPALLAALDKEELESVLAHEIGHVRRQHLLLYVLLLFGFSLLASTLSEPLLGLLLGSGWFWRLLIWSRAPLEKLLTGLAAAVLFVLMLLYFRFLFGYFVRNFERQADLHVFQAQGSSFPLIRSFEKIAALSGASRDQKNWHHFGIGERIDFLLRCERDRRLVRRHDRKVCLSLAAYFLLIGLAVWPLRQLDADALGGTSALVEEKLRQEPENGRWLQLRADLLLERGREKEALAAYEQALQAAPMQAETANNLAWLLLTAQDRSLRDPARALQLAEAAVSREAKGHILDTLAVALWAQGRIEEAVRAERRAARLDPENRRQYQAQAEQFTSGPWH
jgi:tetratricopeptide (TPR) repeat protein